MSGCLCHPPLCRSDLSAEMVGSDAPPDDGHTEAPAMLDVPPDATNPLAAAIVSGTDMQCQFSAPADETSAAEMNLLACADDGDVGANPAFTDAV